MDAVNPSVERWMQPNRPAYRGIYMQQLEDDLFRYTELIEELRPPFIVEIGRAEGGCTALLADRLGDVDPAALVISIDILEPFRLPATRAKVLYLTADSLSDEAIAEVYKAAVGNRGMVLLDGDHSSAQVAAELDAYDDVADYLIVEDTIMRHLGGDHRRRRPPPRPRRVAPRPSRVHTGPRPAHHPASRRLAKENRWLISRRHRQGIWFGNEFVAAGTVLPAGHAYASHPQFVDYEPGEPATPGAPPPSRGRHRRAAGRSHRAGVKVDKRWGADRLRDEIADAAAAEESTTRTSSGVRVVCDRPGAQSVGDAVRQHRRRCHASRTWTPSRGG